MSDKREVEGDAVTKALYDEVLACSAFARLTGDPAMFCLLLDKLVHQLAGIIVVASRGDPETIRHMSELMSRELEERIAQAARHSAEWRRANKVGK